MSEPTAGRRPLRVLACGHGAERTGPPVYLLRLAEWFAASDEVDLEVVLLDDGPLLDPLRALAPVTVLPEWHIPGAARYLPAVGNKLHSPALSQRGRALAMRPYAKAIGAHHGEPDVAWINTAGSVRALRYLPFRPARVVTQVHELSLGLEVHLRPEDRALIERATDRYLVVSSPVRRYLEQRWGVAPDRIGHAAGVVPDPPPARRPAAEVRAAVGAGPDDLVVGTAGTVDWRKAPDLFLALALALTRRLARRVVLVWLGGGAGSPVWAAAHADRARAHLDDVVRFVGEQDDPTDWLRALDLFVLPSREDAYPLVCLEAATVGVPTVTFTTGGIADFVAPEGEPLAGAVVPYPDLAGFADEAARLLDDPQERSRRGEVARRRVLAQHSVEAGARELVHELRTVVAGG
jgi:glycosyltransferase involved in cell wall biosynthesis